MRPHVKPIIIVQGGQYGSEAKGAIAGFLGLMRDVDFAVRTGSINAGHTVYYRGQPYAFQQLPVGWVNPNTTLIIGPGAYVHKPTLDSEIVIVNSLMGGDVRSRIYIDHMAGIHMDEFQAKAQRADRHRLIGATGKGCAEAIVAKIERRGRAPMLFKDWYPGYQFADVPQFLNDAYDGGRQILLEGTQGSSLDLHLGPYPYTTSRQTSASAWVTEAGLSPSLDYEVILVLRTFPIRVAGTSGPMRGEISWVELAREINGKLAGFGRAPLVMESSLVMFEQAVAQSVSEVEHPVDVHKHALGLLPADVITDLKNLFEMTTVTRKLRRIARFDPFQAKRSITLERPAGVALTFLNYVHPEVTGVGRWLDLSPEARSYVVEMAELLDTPIHYVSTGPRPEHIIHLDRP